MKLQIVAIAVILAAVVMAEDCLTGNVAQCTHINCSSGFTKVCDNTICTCSSNANIGCTGLSDCTNSGTCDHRWGWHCVDSVCQCGFGNIGK